MINNNNVNIFVYKYQKWLKLMKLWAEMPLKLDCRC